MFKAISQLEWKSRLVAVLLLTGILFSCDPGAPIPPVNPPSIETETETETEAEITRKDTLIITGGLQYIPDNFNPINWSVRAGMRGLVHDSLFYYDIQSNTVIPWLAKTSTWIDHSTLEIVIRDNAFFSDGDPVTAADVLFSVTYEAWSNPWGDVSGTIVTDTTIQFTFSEPNYQVIAQNLYLWPILKKSLWDAILPETATDITILQEDAIGSGPYTIESHDHSQIVFRRNDAWWGINELNISFPAKRIISLKNMRSDQTAAMLENNEVDFVNQYLPNTDLLKSENSKIHTWQKNPSYFKPGSIAYLFINNQKYPAVLRKALAHAINPDEICYAAYNNTASPVSNALGLLNIPAMSPYNNQDITASLGFSYDPEEAENMLDRAGYIDKDGDGFRESPDGLPIYLKILVPDSLPDYMRTSQILSDCFAAVGINSTPVFKDQGFHLTRLVKGEFDVSINNWGSSPSATPYAIYQWLFGTYAPVSEDDWIGNFGRYNNESMRNLVKDLEQLHISDTTGMNEIIRQIQSIYLRDMPVIPLVQIGANAIANTTYWENWPDEAGTNQHYPSLWHNQFQIGGLLMLSEIRMVE